MSVLIKYEVGSKIKDIIMYCGIKTTIREIQDRINSITKNDVKILYVKF